MKITCKSILYLLGIVTTLFTANSCIEFHPYDTNLPDEYENLNNKGLAAIEKLDQSNDTLRFVWMGDTQRWYDETEDFVNALNKRNDIDFVIHGGDISDFGMKEEYMWVHDIMKKLTVPYVALPGNHDILGNGEAIFKEMYGDLNFEFIFKRTKFINLNTNALEFDVTTPVPDFNFMYEAVGDSLDNTYDRTIVTMHVPPNDVEFNDNVQIPFHQVIASAKGIQFCLHAHAHRFMTNDFFDDGIIYYGCDDIKGKSYMIYTLYDDTYEYEIVYF